MVTSLCDNRLSVAALQRLIDGEDPRYDSAWEAGQDLAAERQAEDDDAAYVKWVNR